MTTKTLDRTRPFGTVVGSSDGSAFHQDGVCFDGSGRELGAPPEEAAAPLAPAPETPEPDPEPETTPGVSEDDLNALHPSQIKKLVAAEGLTLETGQGSKARNIANLLAAG